MKQVLVVAVLALSSAAAQAAAPHWPEATCFHGTTLNSSSRPLQIRTLEGTIRVLLNDAGVPLYTEGCQTYVNVLFQATTLSSRTTRLTAHLVIAGQEVNLTDGARNSAAYPCQRTLTVAVRHEADLQQSAQRLVRRLLSFPPQCSDAQRF